MKGERATWQESKMLWEHWYMKVMLSLHWHTVWTDNSLAAISHDTKVSPTNRTHKLSLSESFHAIWKTEAFSLLIMDLVHYPSESGCNALAFILLPSSNQTLNEAECNGSEATKSPSEQQETQQDSPPLQNNNRKLRFLIKTKAKDKE